MSFDSGRCRAFGRKHDAIAIRAVQTGVVQIAATTGFAVGKDVHRRFARNGEPGPRGESDGQNNECLGRGSATLTIHLPARTPQLLANGY